MVYFRFACNVDSLFFFLTEFITLRIVSFFCGTFSHCFYRYEICSKIESHYRVLGFNQVSQVSYETSLENIVHFLNGFETINHKRIQNLSLYPTRCHIYLGMMRDGSMQVRGIPLPLSFFLCECLSDESRSSAIPFPFIRPIANSII